MAMYMYGRRESDGMPISIHDIPLSMYGRRCGCVCPECGEPFEACSLDGNRDRYFRHHIENRNGCAPIPGGCTAEHANESALHLMAKKIIEQERKVFSTELAVYLSKLGLELPDHVKKHLPRKRVFRAAGTLDCQDVELEKNYPGFRVDASVTTANGTYLIEIWHKHKTDEEKLDKVIECGLPMLEIDISKIVDKCPGFEEMRKFITKTSEGRKWIFFPGESDRINAAKEEYLQHPVVVKFFEEQEREQLKKELRDQEHRKVKQIVDAAFDPTNYRKTVESLHNSANQAISSDNSSTYYFKFFSDTQQIPFFVNIPIRGEIIFRCHRSIWQGKIFDRWIYNRRTDKKNNLYAFDLWKGLVEEENIPYDYNLSRTAKFSAEPDMINLQYAPIRKYLEYLENLGFIAREWPWSTVIQSHSIDPPNQEYAACLKNALMICDEGSIQVDEMIEQELTPYFVAKAEKEMQARKEKEEAERRAKESERKEQELRQTRTQLAAVSEIPLIFLETQQLDGADYDQEDFMIYDKSCVRWMMCTVCNRAVQGWSIGKHMALNKGICKSCLFRQSQPSRRRI